MFISERRIVRHHDLQHGARTVTSLRLMYTLARDISKYWLIVGILSPVNW